MVRKAQLDRFVDLGRRVAGAPPDSELAARFLSYQLELERWVGTGVDISAIAGEAVAEAMLELGRHDEARPWFERAVEAKEQGDVHGWVDPESLRATMRALARAAETPGSDPQADPLAGQGGGRRWPPRRELGYCSAYVLTSQSASTHPGNNGWTRSNSGRRPEILGCQSGWRRIGRRRAAV